MYLGEIGNAVGIDWINGRTLQKVFSSVFQRFQKFQNVFNFTFILLHLFLKQDLIFLPKVISWELFLVLHWVNTIVSYKYCTRLLTRTPLMEM